MTFTISTARQEANRVSSAENCHFWLYPYLYPVKGYPHFPHIVLSSHHDRSSPRASSRSPSRQWSQTSTHWPRRRRLPRCSCKHSWLSLRRVVGEGKCRLRSVDLSLIARWPGGQRDSPLGSSFSHRQNRRIQDWGYRMVRRRRFECVLQLCRSLGIQIPKQSK
jgi:hypothetical protein